ncbi:MAG: c-type cytochrome [Gemmatimonadaceae bacterium]
MRFSLIALVGLSGVMVACGGSSAPSSGGAAMVGADYAAFGPMEGARLGLGRAADKALLAKMDTDIDAEGTGLPAGSGTAAEGAVLYAQQCAMCHAADGRGMLPAFPRLLGRDANAEGFTFADDAKLPHTIGNYWPYATTLFDYIKRAMPLTAPGSLSDDQVYALSAYLLAEEGVIAKSLKLNAESLRAVKMPYVDRFVWSDEVGASR